MQRTFVYNLAFAAALVGALFPIAAGAKPAMSNYDFSKAADYIKSEIDKGVFPGGALMVEHHGKVVYENYWGTYCSPIKNDVPLDNKVRHIFYSVSKIISATVIVIAHQKGLIDYDAPLYTYIPEYRGKWKDTCTIRHLLTHSAGIPNCPLKAVTNQEEWNNALKLAYGYEPEWEPGTRSVYHGTSGMFLAAEAVRRASGLPTWEAVCRKFLFDPLDIKSLTFVPPTDDLVALTPQPSYSPCSLTGDHYPMLGHPAAGCIGQMADVIKILRLNLNDGVYNGKRIINKKEMQEMHRVQYEKEIEQAEANGTTPAFENWGLSWMIKRNLKNHTFGFGQNTCPQTFGHAGIDTVITIAEPKRDFALVFLITNSPKEPAGPIRNTVTDLVTEGIDKAGH